MARSDVGPWDRPAADACWKATEPINDVCPVTMAGRQMLASAGDDGTVRIWDPGTGADPLTVPTSYPGEAIAWVAGSLAIGLGAGILVIKRRAPGWP